MARRFTGTAIVTTWPARRQAFRGAVTLGVALLLAWGTTACGSAPVPAAAAPTSAPAPTPTRVPTPSPTVSAQEACVSTTLDRLTLAQIVGQVMLVGTPIANPVGISQLLTTYAVGGVFLAGRSQAAAADLRTQIATLRAGAAPATGLLVALDQEGGQVQTLHGADFPAIPSAVRQGQLSQPALHAQAVSWAAQLAAIGVTLDLAPVADTVPDAIGRANPPIGALDRQFGADPAAVAADVATVVGAVQSTGVLTTLKHFPGLGRVRQNTDFSTGAVDTVATANDPFLAPFRSGIEAGSAAVMMSLASYPGLDPTAIAAFSTAIVTGLLRQQLGFAGLIVSDDLGATAAVRSVPVDQRAVRFIEAGGDLALTVAPATAAPMIDGLLAAARASTAFAAKVTAAARHVLTTKYTAGLLPCSPPRA